MKLFIINNIIIIILLFTKIELSISRNNVHMALPNILWPKSCDGYNKESEDFVLNCNYSILVLNLSIIVQALYVIAL